MPTLNKHVEQRHSPRASESRHINKLKASHIKKNEQLITDGDCPSKLDGEMLP